MNFKNIHIGHLIKMRVQEKQIEFNRIENLFQCSEQQLKNMYESENITTDMLLKWSKILEYDFFRIYTQHLILYSPPADPSKLADAKNKTTLPFFRKNIYTQEIIEFILEQYNSGEMTKNQIIAKYGIPKTTLYKWISKHKSILINDEENKS